MKKLLTSLALCFATFTVPAQDAPMLPNKPISCLPGGLGSGTVPQIVVNDAGIAVGWWCKKTKAAPYSHVFALRYDGVTLPLVMALKDVMLTTSRLAAMENVRINFAKTDFYSEPMLDVWPDIIPAMLATKPL